MNIKYKRKTSNFKIYCHTNFYGAYETDKNPLDHIR